MPGPQHSSDRPKATRPVPGCQAAGHYLTSLPLRILPEPQQTHTSPLPSSFSPPPPDLRKSTFNKSPNHTTHCDTGTAHLPKAPLTHPGGGRQHSERAENGVGGMVKGSSEQTPSSPASRDKSRAQRRCTPPRRKGTSTLVRFLPPTRETCIECPAPSFGVVQPQLCHAFGKETGKEEICLSDFETPPHVHSPCYQSRSALSMVERAGDAFTVHMPL